MRPIKLEISAWGPYPGKVNVDFNRFQDGSVFLITGPTGAGKTTIFDGISYALYGNVSGLNREKTSVRSDFAPVDVDTYVDFTFSHKGQQYHITRSPKYERPKKRGEGFTISNETAVLEVKGKPPVTSVIEVNRAVEELMGINYDQFKQIAMIAQGEFLNLLFASSKEKVEIFRNLFRTEIYDKIQKNLSEKSKKLYIEMKEQKNKMDEAIASIDSADDETLDELINSKNLNYERIVESLHELIQTDKKYKKECEGQIEKTEKEQNQQITRIHEAEEMNRNLDTLKQTEAKLEELLCQEPEISQVKEQIAKAQAAKSVASNEVRYQEAMLQKRQWVQKIDESNRELSKIDVMIHEITEKVKMLPQMEEELQVCNGQYQKMESLLPLVLNLQESQTKLSDCQNNDAKIAHTEEKLKSDSELLQKQKVTWTEEMNGYVATESQLSELKIQLVQAEQSYKELQKAIKVLKEVSDQTKLLSQLQEKYVEAEEVMKQSRAVYEKKEQLYRNDVIGLAARFLVDDQPCPVCGSLDHPKKAPISHEVPNEDELDLEKKKYEGKLAIYNQIFNETSTKHALLESKKQELQESLTNLGLTDEQDLMQAFVTAKDEGKQLCKQRDELQEKLKHKQELVHKLEECEANLSSLEERLAQIKTKREEFKSAMDVLLGTILSIKEQVPEEYQSKAEIKCKMDELDTKRTRLKKESEQIKETQAALHTKKESCHALLVSHQEELEKAKKNVENSLIEFNQAIEKAGFLTRDDYESKKLSASKEEELIEKVSQYHEKKTQLQAARQHLLEVTKDAKPVELDLLQNQLSELIQRKKEQTIRKEKVIARLIGNQRAFTSLKEKQEKVSGLTKQYGYVKDLEDVSRGVNPERLVFEHYVLAAYFEDILVAANLRLSVMTNSRYELLKVSKVSDARTTNSLDLEVLDQYTGKRRSVKTLSGGESFKAALSLALGLSDVISRNAGGIEIDTLFIDEGFGSLDSESLEQALCTLTNLTGQNKLIGIISHVGELKDRIDNQIIVSKDTTGSSLKVLS